MKVQASVMLNLLGKCNAPLAPSVSACKNVLATCCAMPDTDRVYDAEGDAEGAQGLKIADDMCKRALAVEVFFSPFASAKKIPATSTRFLLLT
jgi:hypothetical protein